MFPPPALAPPTTLSSLQYFLPNCPLSFAGLLTTHTLTLSQNDQPDTTLLCTLLTKGSQCLNRTALPSRTKLTIPLLGLSAEGVVRVRYTKVEGTSNIDFSDIPL